MPISKRCWVEAFSSKEGWYLDGHAPSDATADLQTMLNFELEHGQLSNFQLRLVDRHSMAHSLRSGFPFGPGSPNRFLRPADGLEAEYAREEKAALRRAADLTNLPKDIVRRPKLPADERQHRRCCRPSSTNVVAKSMN